MPNVKRIVISSIAGFAVLLGVCALARAATPLPPAPPNQWCYDTFAPPSYEGVRECASVPPPPATGFSASAPDRASLNYSSHAANESRIGNVPVRALANVIGRINALAPPVEYPWVSGSTVQIPAIGVGRIWQSAFTVPMNLPNGVHRQLRGINYGAGPPPVGVLYSTFIPIDIRVYEVNAAGAFVPINRVGAHKEGAYMDNTTLITFVQGDSANQYWVPLIGGHTYVVEAKWHVATAHGDMMFGYN